MTERANSSLTPFAWVYKRDGRLVPFEADKISRALFAASESQGRPNAFLARELTDGILHFLAAESQAATPTTAQIADLVAKVVRELGHPALARAFFEGQAQKGAAPAKSGPPGERSEVTHTGGEATGVRTPALPVAPVGPSLTALAQWSAAGPPPVSLAWRAAGSCLREYALREVFTRDLAAAQADGLLTLSGLESPFETAGCVLAIPLPDRGGVLEAVEEARSLAGSFVALDSPEYELARLGQGKDGVAAFVVALRTGLRLMHLRAVINLNCAAPPPAITDLAVGPLFPGYQEESSSGPIAELADALLDRCLAGTPGDGFLRVDWHLGPRDFAPASAGRLTELARRALGGAPLAFVFDRPRGDVALAEGLSRRHPATLLAVTLHLPWLVEQLKPSREPVPFLKKLGSLARLALSAATQKRDFLRRHSQARPALTRGFLLERARLVVVPAGLEAAARALTGRGLCAGGSSLEFGRQVVVRLGDALRQDGQAYLLDAGLDSAPPGPHLLAREGEAAEPESLEQAAGLTPWDGATLVKNQLRAAGLLHAAADAGTAAVLLAGERAPTAGELVDWLDYAWKQTDVVRVRFLRSGPARPQANLPDGQPG